MKGAAGNVGVPAAEEGWKRWPYEETRVFLREKMKEPLGSVAPAARLTGFCGRLLAIAFTEGCVKGLDLACIQSHAVDLNLIQFAPEVHRAARA